MKRILVVEDDNTSHEILNKCLGQCGYSILHAHDGNEGLGLASTNEPDLLIVDLRMPEMDGDVMIRRLRSDVRFIDTPVVVLSGEDGLQSKLDAFDAGADDFLVKPFDTSELTARISRLLQRQNCKFNEDHKALTTRVICVHGMKGGVGCSTISVNLAIAMKLLWNKKTLLIDTATECGRLEMFLDLVSPRTWGDLKDLAINDLDISVLQKLVNVHESGLHFLASPSTMKSAKHSREIALFDSVTELVDEYEYVIVDVGNKWDEESEKFLKRADRIVMVAGTDLISIANILFANENYEDVGISDSKTNLVMSLANEESLNIDQIGKTIQRTPEIVFPYAADQNNRLLNQGAPFLSVDLTSKQSGLFLELAFLVSKRDHVNVPPPNPTAAWKQVHKQPSDQLHSTKITDIKATTGFLFINLVRNLIR